MEKEAEDKLRLVKHGGVVYFYCIVDGPDGQRTIVPEI